MIIQCKYRTYYLIERNYHRIVKIKKMEFEMKNKRKIKVSFDFDDTLSNPLVQKFAGELLKNYLLEIWIVTSRLDEKSFDKKYGPGFKFNCNEDLFSVARHLKIPERRIIFTKLEWKYMFFKDKDFAIHIDDLPQDIEYIRANTPMFCVDVLQNDWRRQTNKLIKKLTAEKQIK